MTTLMRWNPTTEIQRMRHLMDSFFEDFSGEASRDVARPFATPAMDIVDAEDHVEISVDLPGVSSDDVEIEFKDRFLTISASVSRDENIEEKRFTRRERYRGTFQRSLHMSDTLDAQAAKADFADGVLTLIVPKKEEAQPLRIAVGDNKKVIESGKN